MPTGEGDQDPVPTSDPPLPPLAAQLERFSASFEWLASVDLESLFAKRACFDESSMLFHCLLFHKKCR